MLYSLVALEHSIATKFLKQILSIKYFQSKGLSCAEEMHPRLFKTRLVPSFTNVSTGSQLLFCIRPYTYILDHVGRLVAEQTSSVPRYEPWSFLRSYAADSSFQPSMQRDPSSYPAPNYPSPNYPAESYPSPEFVDRRRKSKHQWRESVTDYRL